MDENKDALDKNPFNVPFVLAEMCSKFMEKLENHHSNLYTYNEIFCMMDETVYQLCSSTEQEMIKGKAIEFLIAYLKISRN